MIMLRRFLDSTSLRAGLFTVGLMATLTVISAVYAEDRTTLSSEVLSRSRGSNNAGTPVNETCASYSNYDACTDVNKPATCYACEKTNYSASANGGMGYGVPTAGAGNCGSTYTGTCIAKNNCKKAAKLDSNCDNPPGAPPVQPPPPSQPR